MSARECYLTRADELATTEDLPITNCARGWAGKGTLERHAWVTKNPFSRRKAPSRHGVSRVTGTRWNGLAFFGLTSPGGGARKERPHAEK
jgi:hypothetical protein